MKYFSELSFFCSSPLPESNERAPRATPAACQLGSLSVYLAVRIPVAPGMWFPRGGSRPGLDLGPQRGSCRPRDIPFPALDLSIISCGCRAPVLVGGWELSVLNEGDWCGHAPASGRPPGCSLGWTHGVQAVLAPPACPRPGGRENKQLSHLSGRFMVLLVKACPGPVQSGMALDVGTINPAYYFFTSLPPHKQLLWLLVSQPHALLLAWPPANRPGSPMGTPVLIPLH